MQKVYPQVVSALRSEHGEDVPMPARKPPTETVRIPSEIARKLRIISAVRDVAMTDYLAEILASLIEKEYQESVKIVSKEAARPNRKQTLPAE